MLFFWNMGPLWSWLVWLTGMRYFTHSVFYSIDWLVEKRSESRPCNWLIRGRGRSWVIKSLSEHTTLHFELAPPCHCVDCHLSDSSRKTCFLLLFFTRLQFRSCIHSSHNLFLTSWHFCNLFFRLLFEGDMRLYKALIFFVVFHLHRQMNCWLCRLCFFFSFCISTLTFVTMLFCQNNGAPFCFGWGTKPQPRKIR